MMHGTAFAQKRGAVAEACQALGSRTRILMLFFSCWSGNFTG